MKQTIKLTESELRNYITEAVKRQLSEESYRKAAKKGEHTSSALKRALNFAKKENGTKPKDFHKFADKYGLDKRNHNSICDYEDRCYHDGRPVDESCYKSKQTIRLTESKLRNIISESIRQMINEHGRGNDWNKRVEWNAFQDPLVIKSRQRNNTHSVRYLLQKIINSPWWKILQQNGCRPDFHCVATDSFDEDGEIDTLDSPDIEEIRDFYEQYKDGRNSYNIYIYCYTDNIGDNVKNPAIENIIYAAGEGCFNIQDYDYYEPRINDVLKKYINKKRLNNV